MRNTKENVMTAGRADVYSYEDFIQKIEEGEANIREGRVEDAFEWLARFKARHNQNMKSNFLKK